MIVESIKTAWFFFTFLKEILLGTDAQPKPMTKERRFLFKGVIFLLCLSCALNFALFKRTFTLSAQNIELKKQAEKVCPAVTPVPAPVTNCNSNVKIKTVIIKSKPVKYDSKKHTQQLRNIDREPEK